MKINEILLGYFHHWHSQRIKFSISSIASFHVKLSMYTSVTHKSEKITCDENESFKYLIMYFQSSISISTFCSKKSYFHHDNIVMKFSRASLKRIKAFSEHLSYYCSEQLRAFRGNNVILVYTFQWMNLFDRRFAASHLIENFHFNFYFSPPDQLTIAKLSDAVDDLFSPTKWKTGSALAMR